jgi:hypothetical protein
MMTKMLLRDAAAKFVEKPKVCFRFLQDQGSMALKLLIPFPDSAHHSGALDNPLTPFSVAKFLRICPGLPKEAAGSFLGEAGKDKFEHEWDDPQFHKDVLHYYVRSFELSNQVPEVPPPTLPDSPRRES